MNIEDIIPVSDLRRDAATVIARAKDTKQPIFITQRGRTSAVLIDARVYLEMERELESRRAFDQSAKDIAAGRWHEWETVRSESEELLAKDE